jgi:hypothetical protein
MVKRVITGAHYGLKDWLAQRVTAVIMAAYTLMFVVALGGHARYLDGLHKAYGPEITASGRHHIVAGGLWRLGNADYLEAVTWVSRKDRLTR